MSELKMMDSMLVLLSIGVMRACMSNVRMKPIALPRALSKRQRVGQLESHMLFRQPHVVLQKGGRMQHAQKIHCVEVSACVQAYCCPLM